jgi:C4-dicarboxylate-specific signal transduction histidine kinase
LSNSLLAEQAKMAEELEHLRKQVEHIKEIIAMQQNFAKVSGVAETVLATELVEDAIRINSSSLTWHEVKIVRDFRAKPTLNIERHKVMQVLVNLIRNAKQACDETSRDSKTGVVRITEAARRVSFSIVDNGVGIPGENLARIFAHGFSTKKDGHGFGLHSAALSAKELRGTLIASSAGLGLGATFVLNLPIDPAQA